MTEGQMDGLVIRWNVNKSHVNSDNRVHMLLINWKLVFLGAALQFGIGSCPLWSSFWTVHLSAECCPQAAHLRWR